MNVKRIRFSYDDIIFPTDKVEALKSDTTFNGFITFKLDDDKTKILRENSQSKLIPIRFMITYGMIEWDGLLSSTGSVWKLKCFFSKKHGQRLLRELSSSADIRAIVIIGPKPNELALEVRNISAKKPNNLTEQTVANLNLMREITLLGTDISFVSYPSLSSSNTQNKTIFELHLRIDNLHLPLFTPDGDTNHLFESIFLRIDNTRVLGNLVKLHNAHELVCVFSSDSPLKILKSEIEKNEKTIIKIRRNTGINSYCISYASSVADTRRDLQDKFVYNQNSEYNSEKKFIPGCYSEKKYSGTIPKRKDLDKLFW